MPKLRDHKDVIDQWESPILFAEDVGIDPSYARCIKARNAIPSTLFQRVVEAATMRGKSGITLQLLHDTAPKRRTKRAA